MSIIFGFIVLSGLAFLLTLFKAGSLGVGTPLERHEHEEQMYALSRAAQPARRSQSATPLFKTQI
jgi:hypothetical protein